MIILRANLLCATFLRGILLSVVVLSMVSLGRAGPIPQKSTVSKSIEKTPIEVPDTDLKFNYGLGYSTSSDFAVEKSPRLFKHNLGVDGGVDWRNWFKTGASLGWYFDSLGFTSPVFDETPDSRPGFAGSWWSTLCYDKKFGEALEAQHSGGTSLTFTIPFGEEDRYYGIRSTLGAGLNLTSSWLDNTFKLTHGIGGNYTVHTYSYSPTSNRPNSNYALRYRLSASVNVGWGISGFLSGIFGNAHYFDRTWFPSISSSVGVKYKYQMFSVSIKYSNGYHIENGRLNLWIFDQYRQELEASASLSF